MVEYRELATDTDFDQVCELQRRVFGFTDLELVSPLMLRLVARNNPPMGVHLGAFVVDESGSRMVGAMIGFATLLERSLYIVLLGVLPEYQEGLYGYRLLLQYRELCVAREIPTVHGLYDALETKLARLYNGGVGLIGLQFLEGKILFRWDFLSEHTLAKLQRKKKTSEFSSGDPRPLVGPDHLPDATEVLFEIPPADANGREAAQIVLAEYLNQRHYTIVDCATARMGEERKAYYVLRQTL
jgi:predicted GNAT superfamily acetyltransferase